MFIKENFKEQVIASGAKQSLGDRIAAALKGLAMTSQGLVSLAVAVVIYFAAIRIFQDYLYAYLKLGRPDNLFQSFGVYFARPEPLEMPFYLLGFLVIPVLALGIYCLWQRFYKPQYLKYIFVLGAIAFLAGGLGVLWKIGIPKVDLSVYTSYLREEGLGKSLWLLLTKRIFVTRLILVLTLIVFAVAYFLRARIDWLARAADAKVWKKLEIIFLLLIALLLFHPNLPTQDHHFNYFIGSTNDVLHGRPLLYETTHLYGLLNIYFLIALAKLGFPFGYVTLSLILFIFYLTFFAALYYFQKKWFSSRLLAMLGAISLVTILFFFQTSPTRTSYFFPAMTPFRFWLYVPVLFLILAYQKIPKAWYQEVALGLSALALFWNFDSGAFLTAATLFTFWYSANFQIKQAFRLGLKYLAYLAGIFAVLTLGNYLVYHAWPNWHLFFTEVSPFGVGIGMTPLPLVGLFEIFILLYLGVILWSGYRFWQKLEVDLPLLFLTVFGIFSLLYYIGESTWQNLYLVSAPAILTALYISKSFPEKRFIAASFYALLGLVSMFLLVKLPVEFASRDYTQVKALSHIDAEDQDLYADAEYIKENFSEKRILLIHLRDTKFLFYSQKTNWFDFYYIFNLYYHEDIEKLIKKVEDDKPQHLLIGKEQNDQIKYFTDRALAGYKKTADLRTLEIYTLE